MKLIKAKASEAQAVYCPQCNHVYERSPYWGLNKTKGSHEYGSPGHKPIYVKLAHDG